MKLALFDLYTESIDIYSQKIDSKKINERSNR